jgi:hypothetical protein
MINATRIALRASLLATVLAAAACSSDQNGGPLAPGGAGNSPTAGAGQPQLDSLAAGLKSKLPETPNKRDSVVTKVGDVTDTTTANQQVTVQRFAVQRVKYSITSNPEKFMMVDVHSGVVWPGALVQGGSVANNAPLPIPVPDSVRRPLSVTLNILSGAGAAGGLSRKVDQPSNASVQNAMASILAGYKGGTPAKVSLNVAQMYSASQLNASLDLGYTGPSFNASAALGVQWGEKKNRFVVSLIQQFFTMSINDPDGPSGMWDVAKYGVNDLRFYASSTNPVTYVSSVTYGRVYYLLYESNEDALKVRAALDAAYNGGIASGTVSAKTDYERTLANSSVKMYQLGGNAEDGFNAATAKSFDAIQSFLKKGANFSDTNIGVPLSFIVRYLYDNSIVKLANTMEYEVEEKVPVGQPTISWVQTHFNLTVDRAQPWGWNIWEKGALQMRLLSFDPSGTERELWPGSPCNYDCGKPGYKIRLTPASQGPFEQLAWNSWTVYVDNRPGQRFVVECKVFDYDRNDSSIDRITFKWDPTSAKFLQENLAQSPTRCEAHTRDNKMNAMFFITIRQNDVVQTDAIK